ncbi:MAG: hypothetical protein P0S95_00750 [Rhabdochlamydiaceae bacterium]|nr:hypothetical protein [Candidatus Amphrikana amoebophyrae]
MTRKDSIVPHILAYAVMKAFPSSKLIGGGSTPLNFFYNIRFDFEFSSDALHSIEEALCSFLANPKTMKIMEMIPANAQELLSHHKQEVRGEVAEESGDQFANVLRIGDFYDYIGLISSDKIEFNHAKIVEWSVVGSWMDKPIIQIVGVGADTKPNMIAKQKMLKKALKGRHDVLGEKMGLFYIDESNEVFWHSRGQALRRLLIDEWYERVEKMGVEIISTPGLRPFSKRFDDYQKINPKCRRLAEIGSVERYANQADALFAGGVVRGDLIRFVGSKETLEGDLKAALDMICAFWTDCNLTKGDCVYVDFQTLLDHEQEIELQAADVFGRPQKISSLRLKELKKGLFELNIRVFWSMSSFIALIIEKNKGGLPFFLEPIQIDIAVLKRSLMAEAEQIKINFEQNGVRVRIYSHNIKQKHEAMALSKSSHAPFFFTLFEEGKGYVLERGNKKFDTVDVKDFIKSVLKDAKKS